MDSRPLVIEQTDAGAELLRKLHPYVQVEAAFWLNPSEDGRWALYIASPEIDMNNYDHAYGEALRIAQSMNTPNIDPFQVRIIRVVDPMARAAIAFNRKYPGNSAIRLRDKQFGETYVEEVYIYPSQLVAATK